MEDYLFLSQYPNLCRTSNIVGSDFMNKKLVTSFPCILLNVWPNLKAFKEWNQDEPLIWSSLVVCRMVLTPGAQICVRHLREKFYTGQQPFSLSFYVFFVCIQYIFQVIHSGSVQMLFSPTPPLSKELGKTSNCLK